MNADIWLAIPSHSMHTVERSLSRDEMTCLRYVLWQCWFDVLCYLGVCDASERHRPLA